MSSPVVAFSTNGIDTHGGYDSTKSGAPTYNHDKLITTLHKLGLRAMFVGGGVYTIPMSGMYQVSVATTSEGSKNTLTQILSFKAGDTVNVLGNSITSICRL